MQDGESMRQLLLRDGLLEKKPGCKTRKVIVREGIGDSDLDIFNSTHTMLHELLHSSDIGFKGQSHLPTSTSVDAKRELRS